MAHTPAVILRRLRSRRAPHYSVVVVAASLILFLYYSYTSSLPTPPGHYLAWFWGIFQFEFRNNVLGILLLIPILYCALTLGWKRAAIVLIVMLACVAPYIVSYSYRTYTMLASFSCLLIPPTLIIATEIKLIADANERRARAERKRERAEVMRQLFGMLEDERKRISQELHDGVVQTLLVNATMAHNISESKAITDEHMATNLDAIKQTSLHMVAEIRCLCQDLRPNILDNLGLVSSVKWLLDTLHEETGIDVDFSLDGPVSDLTQEQSVALFRIVQETLNNVKKHAEATVVQVAISFFESGLTIRIRDNGKGFDSTRDGNRLALTGKLGILGMNERAQSIGATLEIKAGKGSGAEITVSL
jgi:two-component system sensor histidine kinase DegS